MLPGADPGEGVSIESNALALSESGSEGAGGLSGNQSTNQGLLDAEAFNGKNPRSFQCRMTPVPECDRSGKTENFTLKSRRGYVTVCYTLVGRGSILTTAASATRSQKHGVSLASVQPFNAASPRIPWVALAPAALARDASPLRH